MGFSSELHIEMHNDAMRTDEAYAAEYYDGADEPEYLNWYLVEPDETAIDWFSDRRLDFTGYEEFECGLCYEFTPDENGHSLCHFVENNYPFDDLPF